MKVFVNLLLPQWILTSVLLAEYQKYITKNILWQRAWRMIHSKSFINAHVDIDGGEERDHADKKTELAVPSEIFQIRVTALNGICFYFLFYCVNHFFKDLISISIWISYGVGFIFVTNHNWARATTYFKLISHLFIIFSAVSRLKHAKV
jgi:hypothetical protein